MDDRSLQEFFGKASRYRLSVREHEHVYHRIIGIRAPYQGSFLWRTMTMFFRSWTPVAAVMIVLVLTGAGMVVAKDSLPGEFLYPLKRASEELRSKTRLTVESQASVQADSMDRRLEEATTLQVKGKFTDQTSSILDQEYRRQRRDVIVNIQQIQSSGNREAVAKLRARLNAAEDRYERLFKGKRRQVELNKAPPAVMPAVRVQEEVKASVKVEALPVPARPAGGRQAGSAEGSVELPLGEAGQTVPGVLE